MLILSYHFVLILCCIYLLPLDPIICLISIPEQRHSKIEDATVRINFHLAPHNDFTISSQPLLS